MKEQNLVESLIFHAGFKLGKSQLDIQPFVKKIVEENWIDTIDCLKSTQPSRLIDLGVPSRLVDEIYKLLQSDTDFQDNGDTIMSKNKKTKSSIYPDHIENLLTFEVKYDVPDDCPVLNMVIQSLEELRRECEDNIADYINSLQVLLRIVDEILKDPQDSKKRKIKSTNAVFSKRIIPYRGAQNVLKAIGFTVCDKTQIWTLAVAHMVRLTDTHHIIASTLTSMNIPTPPVPICHGFNPYKASIETSDSNNLLRVPGPVRDAYQSKLKDFFKQAEILAQSSCNEIPIPEEPRVYKLQTDSPFIKTSECIDPITDFSDSDILHSLSTDLLKKLKTNTLGHRTFCNRSLAELEANKKRNSYKKTLLKIYFPDHLVLEISFSAQTQLSQVYQSINKYLDSSIRSLKWYLYETPPRRVIPSGPQTLISEVWIPKKAVYIQSCLKLQRLVPAAKLYFTSDNIPAHMKWNTKYLSHESLESFFLAPNEK